MTEFTHKLFLIQSLLKFELYKHHCQIRRTPPVFLICSSQQLVFAGFV